MRYTRIHLGAHRRVNRFPASRHFLAWFLPHLFDDGSTMAEWEESGRAAMITITITPPFVSA